MSWPSVELASLTTKIGSGATPTGGQSSYQSDGVPLIRSMNIHDGVFRDEGLAYLSEAQAGALENVTLQKGDVLLNITGASVARSCRLPERYEGGRVNQHVAIIRPIPTKLLPEYLEHYLINPQTKVQLLRIAGAGATREAITKAAIERLAVPLPPLAEQKCIAAILDQADGLRRKRQRAIDRLNQLGQAIFYEMFGDPNSSNGWRYEERDIAEVCVKVTDGTHQSPQWSDEGVPFIFVSNVRNQRIDLMTKKFVSEGEYEKLTKHTKIETGDVLYTCVGSYGHAAVVDGLNKFAFQRHIALLKPSTKLIQSQFLAWCLESPIVRAQADRVATGIAQKTVTLSGLKSFKVPLPPLDRQEDFAKRLAALNRSKLASEIQLTKLEALFNAAQHRAFLGEL